MKKSRSFWSFSSYISAFFTTLLTTLPAFAVAIVDGQPISQGTNFQPSASPMHEKMVYFHNGILMPLITGISLFVLAVLIIIVIRFNKKANPKPSKTTHNVPLEIVWTLIPIFILIALAVPSMKMLYYVDKTVDAEMTLKVIGSQWYWNYEYPDHGDVGFMSNMIPDKEIKENQVRLLSTDAPVVLPVDTNVKLLITASDVIHSWAVPALGIKLDAVPGRLNETWVRITREGTYFGQCSEICGTGHAFMPIEIKAVSKKAFAKWVKKQGGKMPLKKKTGDK